MSIDSKSVNLLSSDGVAERIIPRPVVDTGTVARSMTMFIRMALFLFLLIFSVLCGYEYASALLYRKDSMPSGWVGLLAVALAMTEMTMADYAERLPFYRASKEATIPYGFFVIGGFATTFSLLLYDQQIAGVVALHAMVFFAVVTTVLGLAIIWSCISEAGEKLMDMMEASW